MTIASGTYIGPYEIAAPLGSGGMGEVYRATDTRLDRSIAIKVLPERLSDDAEALARFENEAKTVAALSHPNILAIHDVGRENGVSFAVLELLEGQTLADRVRSSPIVWREAIEIGIAIVDGLTAAHSRGIIHRDLKPANIFLTADGQVKILDFGLARMAEPIYEHAENAAQPASHDAPTTSHDWNTGVLMGTIGYVSPERVRGEPGEATSDIFSFGCVMFEMLTGMRSFQRRTAIETAAAILNEEAPGLVDSGVDVPSELEWLIRRCLEKAPERRFQSANDLADALRAVDHSELGDTKEYVMPAMLSPIESLVVLPLANLSDPAEPDYFADGMTEALIADLAKIGALRVISRTSAMRYKGSEKPLPEIARELKVQAAVEGSVMRVDDRVRITANLIDAATDQTIWGESYDRELRDILTLQAEVARAIAREIRIKLTPQEQARLTCVQQVDPHSHEFYLMGRYYWNKRTGETLVKAVECFQQAIEHDPTYALAHAGLADSYNMLGFYSLLPPQEAFPEAMAEAEKAMMIDDGIAEAHASLAFVKFYHDWEWSSAESEFKRAIQLNPGYATAHHWYAEYFAAMQQHQACIAEFKRAHELDPLSLIIGAGLGWAFYFARQYDQAVEQCLKTLEMDAGFVPARLFLGQAYVQIGSYEEAIAEFRKALKLSGSSTEILAELGHALAIAGRQEDAHQILAELMQLLDDKHVSAYAIAIVHLGLGDIELAFAWLEKAFEERSHSMPLINIDPKLDCLRSDPRYADLRRRVGLPSSAPNHVES